jgi:glycosyltransferase involved in cell wall biosynthesis
VIKTGNVHSSIFDERPAVKDNPMSQPLASVVTPFHNTAPYLAQCIESVLRQTYSNFEYILVDNCSTDGSGEIAARYAQRDPRIRLVRRTALLSQVQNYNAALAEISAQSAYCKIVQADDYIFPECLRLMIDACDQSDSIGLVSSYWLKGSQVRGGDLPYPTPFLKGPDMARLYLRTGTWVFASPTTVLYRSSLVRTGEPFYEEGRLHEDSEKCMQILEKWDFAFVHQVLSFSRADNESISSAARDLLPTALDRYIMVQRFAGIFLEPDEAAAVRKRSKQAYYRALAHQSLRLRNETFWQYQRKGLKQIGEKLDRPFLASQIIRHLLEMVANPGTTLGRAFRSSKKQGGPQDTKQDREKTAGTHLSRQAR